MIEILSPKYSFVRFGEQDDLGTCKNWQVAFCLPVYSFDDIAFQFIAKGTEEEINELCDFENDLVTVGLVDDCDSEFSLDFKDEAGLKPERSRISETEVLYNWAHGFPGFDAVYAVGKCFRVKVIIERGAYADVTACSNCFERIAEDCFTSVIDYGGSENQFDFNYCGSGEMFEDTDETGGRGSESCEPTIIQFADVDTIDEEYTAEMQAKYGDVPTVEIWILDSGQYVQPIIRVGFDAFPPTRIIADLGGLASGFVTIS